MIKKILLGLLAALVLIQLFRPTKNVSEERITANDVSKVYAIPDDVHQLLMAKCYDCHSNNTNYPWYSNLQPVAWWLAHHIDEGKAEVNFSEFRSYPREKALHKLEEVGEVTQDGSMPLESYTLLHHNAKITPEEQSKINNWLKSLDIEVKAAY